MATWDDTTGTLHTTVAELVDALDAAVADRGEDFVYPRRWKWAESPADVASCMYVQPDGSGPACLIGTQLHRLGVPLDNLQIAGDVADLLDVVHVEVDGQRLIHPNHLDVDDQKHMPEDHRRLVNGMAAAQLAQDESGTWGDAARAAHACFSGEVA